MNEMKQVSNLNKHITEKERAIIKYMLDSKSKLKDISLSLSKDKSAISREIKRHRQLVIRKNAAITCGNYNECQTQLLCNDCENGICKYCKHRDCEMICTNYIDNPQCKTTLRYPHVCNGCEDKSKCKLPKYFYNDHEAQLSYKNLLIDSRKGSRYTNQELAKFNQIINQGVEDKLSLDVITHTTDIGISTSTAYRLIWRKDLDIHVLDLKKAGRYRVKSPTKPKMNIDYDYLKNRAYSDYLSYIESNEVTNVWQLDTVEGVKGENQSVLLTLLHERSNLQLIIKMPSKTIESVTSVFDSIKSYLGDDFFKETFEIILTDNGSEFKNPKLIENSLDRTNKIINVFYCEARRSDQKGKCEKNHRHIREYIPKSTSINKYNEEFIIDMSTKINAMPRRKFNYNSPIDIAKLMLNKKVIDLISLNFKQE